MMEDPEGGTKEPGAALHPRRGFCNEVRSGAGNLFPMLRGSYGRPHVDIISEVLCKIT